MQSQNSFVVNQGVHKEENILIAEQAIAKITGLKMHSKKDGFMIVTMQIMQPAQFTGQYVNYDCPYDGSHQVAFLYTNLRKACGHPYKKGEQQNIDLFPIMMHKAIKIKLSARQYEGSDYQDVKVLGPAVATVANPQASVVQPPQQPAQPVQPVGGVAQMPPQPAQQPVQQQVPVQPQVQQPVNQQMVQPQMQQPVGGVQPAVGTPQGAPGVVPQQPMQQPQGQDPFQSMSNINIDDDDLPF